MKNNMIKKISDRKQSIILLCFFFSVFNATAIELILAETIPIKETYETYIENISDIEYSPDTSKFVLSNYGSRNIVIYSSNGLPLHNINISTDDNIDKVEIIHCNDSIGVLVNKHYAPYDQLILGDSIITYYKLNYFSKFYNDSIIFGMGYYRFEFLKGRGMKSFIQGKKIACIFKINYQNLTYEHFPLKRSGLYFPNPYYFSFYNNSLQIPVLASSKFIDSEDIADTNKIVVANYDFDGNFLEKYIFLPKEYIDHKVNYSITYEPYLHSHKDTVFVLFPYLNKILNRLSGEEFIMGGLDSPVEQITSLDEFKKNRNKYFNLKYNNFTIFQDTNFLVSFSRRSQIDSSNKFIKSDHIALYNRYTGNKEIIDIDMVENIKLVKYIDAINKLVVINVENEQWIIRKYDIKL
jgi:predicted transcriptional regulator with HTH domain